MIYNLRNICYFPYLLIIFIGPCNHFCNKWFVHPVFFQAMDRTEVQEAVRDARVISNISDLCLKQTEHMSANVVQFRYSEYAERLVTKMKGVVRENGTVHISQRKLNLLGMEAKQLFFRSPVLVTLNGALGFSQPKPKERKQKVTKLKKTKARILCINC